MNYVIIANTVFSLIYTLLGLLISHFIIFAIVGVFFNKKYPKADKKLRYGLVIPARNEEKVIARLVKSLKDQSYDKSLYEIFVAADNCTDKTAECAKIAKNELEIALDTYGFRKYFPIIILTPFLTYKVSKSVFAILLSDDETTALDSSVKNELSLEELYLFG